MFAVFADVVYLMFFIHSTFGNLLLPKLQSTVQMKGREFVMECSSQNWSFVNRLMKENPCLQCDCNKNDKNFSRHGRITCNNVESVCAVRKTCPVVLQSNFKQCCEECKGCSYLGQHYANNAQWVSGQDSCRILACKGGVITMSRRRCVALCKQPSFMIGQCCPLCPPSNDTINAVLDGQVTAKESMERQVDDPCVQCECTSLLCQCYRNTCPLLDCPLSEHVYTPGTCCPECREPRKDNPAMNRCTFQNITYNVETSFRPDPCSQCRCEIGGSVTCQRFSCPVTDCPSHRLYRDRRLCCPLCRDRDPLTCRFEGVEYQHGAAWKSDLCTTCRCRNGETRCTRFSCPFPNGCPHGYVPRKVAGRCCPICEEEEATCTVYGDPHYETFDGKPFNFQGTCKYTLAKLCTAPGMSTTDFSVIVRNDPRGSKGFAWTKRITVHLGSSHRISLLPNKVVRYNGKRVALPYVRLGIFTIFMDRNDFVMLRNMHGIKVVWDGKSYAELSLSPAYKSSVCGLCGNYNHNTADDHTTRKGYLEKNSYEFGQSWRSGGKKHCKLDRDRYHKPQRRPAQKQLWRQWSDKFWASYKPEETLETILVLPPVRQQLAQANKRRRFNLQQRRQVCDRKRKEQADKRCAVLKSPVFASCHGLVDNRRYFRSCRSDTCRCPLSGKCYCQSLLAYARACAKAGGNEIDWRRYSECHEKVTCSILGAVFSPCSAPAKCQPSCDNPNLTSLDSSCAVCTPACECPVGTLLHNGACVKASQCP